MYAAQGRGGGSNSEDNMEWLKTIRGSRARDERDQNCHDVEARKVSISAHLH